MSPNINSFVGDLVAMAQAMEELPKAQAMIEDLQKQLNDAQRHNQGLEQNIMGYKADIDGLNQRLTDTSKAKDDIELRLMEMEDRFSSVSRFLGSLMGEANTLRNIIDPPKPEPSVAPEPISNPVVDHVDATAQYSSETPSDSDTSANVGHKSYTPSPTPDSPPQDKYADLMYEDYPHWVSRDDWKAGGGTDWSYDYRKPRGNINTII